MFLKTRDSLAAGCFVDHPLKVAPINPAHLKWCCSDVRARGSVTIGPHGPWNSSGWSSRLLLCLSDATRHRARRTAGSTLRSGEKLLVRELMDGFRWCGVQSDHWWCSLWIIDKCTKQERVLAINYLYIYSCKAAGMRERRHSGEDRPLWTGVPGRRCPSVRALPGGTRERTREDEDRGRGIASGRGGI